jgi:hypothetical protein
MYDGSMTEKNLGALLSRREHISRQIAKLRAEDAELSIAERVLRRLLGGAVFEDAADKAQRANAAPKTQKDIVIEVLRVDETVWMKSGEIVEAARRRLGADIPERSLRPLLSVMKRDGLIVRQGRLIALNGRQAEPLGKERAVVEFKRAT